MRLYFSFIQEDQKPLAIHSNFLARMLAECLTQALLIFHLKKLESVICKSTCILSILFHHTT